MMPNDKLKKHPVDVFRNRRARLSRVHALEIARRALEQGGDESMMPLTSPMGPQPPQMGGPMPGMPGMPMSGMGGGNPFEGL